MGKTKLRIVIVALLVAVALITVGCEKATDAEEAKKFTITYSAGTGTGTPPTDDTKYGVGDKVTVKGQGEMTAPSGTPTFTGWNTAATPTATSTAVAVGGEYTVVASDADATGVITLYAQWS